MAALPEDNIPLGTADTALNGAKAKTSSSNSRFPAIVELNVGGVFYSTSLVTLTSEPTSRLAKIFSPDAKTDSVLRDTKVKQVLCEGKRLAKDLFLGSLGRVTFGTFEVLNK